VPDTWHRRPPTHAFVRSERVHKSRSGGQRLEEAKKINKSIAALGNCVAALADKAAHVPFRDSKLTRLLTETLGGNAKSCICANVRYGGACACLREPCATTPHSVCSPANVSFEETNSTLAFALRAMAVHNHARVNEMVMQDPCKRPAGSCCAHSVGGASYLHCRS
jgi:kinesin family protein 5